MIKMKKRKKKTAIIIFIICILFIVWMINSMKYSFLQEDLIFFQLFSSVKQSSSKIENSKEIESQITDETTRTATNTSIEKQSSKSQNANQTQFIFDVQYKHTKLTDINLLDTVDNKTLVYEKIAPGTSGGFDIVLKSNQQIHYKIQFKSENEKPKNLQFYTSNNTQKYNALEELGETLEGSIAQNEEKIVPIFWEWIYEKSEESDMQDTFDAQNIQQYNFLIYVQGF